MAVRNLYRQARPFRFLGWALFGLVVVAPPADILSLEQRLVGLLFACGGMFSLDALRFISRHFHCRDPSDRQVVFLQRFELALVPGLLVFLQFPFALVVAVLGALLNANVALGGRRAMLLAAALVGVSTGFAVLVGAAPLSLLPNDHLWLASVVLLLVFTVALADIGFQLTQKLDDHRQQWQERLAVLQPFVPQGLSRGQPQQARVWITVVMIDLVEFTTRSSPLAPEVVGTVLDDLLDAVVSKANQTGGTLDKFMGDGVLLFFPAATLEDGRARAARSALEFVVSWLDQLPTLNARWHGFGVSEEFRVRAGIASGYCSLGQWGRSDVRAYTMIGTCVGLAERLQAVSAEDAMALCPVTARLLLDPISTGQISAAQSAPPHNPRMPEDFGVQVAGRELSFEGVEQTLKGFAQMRVYRSSVKVREPPN